MLESDSDAGSRGMTTDSLIRRLADREEQNSAYRPAQMNKKRCESFRRKSDKTNFHNVHFLLLFQ